MHHWLQTPNNCSITTNGAIPASEYYSFRNTGKWLGVAIMVHRAPNKYGSFDNDIQLQLGPTVTWD